MVPWKPFTTTPRARSVSTSPVFSKALSHRAEALKPRAPVSVKPGDTVTLRFFADRSVFELYANDEVVISNAGFFADPENLKAELFQRGGAAAEVKVEAWAMNPLERDDLQARRQGNENYETDERHEMKTVILLTSLLLAGALISHAADSTKVPDATAKAEQTWTADFIWSDKKGGQPAGYVFRARASNWRKCRR